jgi:ribosomal protein S18 acetylase RimI-like enzyme
MNNYIFSLAERSDILEIVGIYHSLIGTPGCTWNSYYPNQETAESDITDKSLYTLKKDGSILAVASMGKFNEYGHLQWSLTNPCEMARIGVAPSQQGKGVGTVMLRHLIQTAKDKGFDGIRILVSKGNHAALALYEKNGFVRCGEACMFEIDFYCYQRQFSKKTEEVLPCNANFIM